MLRLGVALALLVVAAAFGGPGTPAPARALELCSPEARGLMRSVGISRAKIRELCARARRHSALLAVSLARTEDELGYCRVTLALQNNSTEYVNSLTLTSANGRFEIFRFHNVLPGGTGYASASSRILLACDELEQVGLAFHWPASLRLGDRSLNGHILQRYKPVLLDEALAWKR